MAAGLKDLTEEDQPPLQEIRPKCPDCDFCQGCSKSRCRACRSGKTGKIATELPKCFTYADYEKWKSGKENKGRCLEMGLWDKITGIAGNKQQNEEVQLMSQQEAVKLYTLSTCSHCRATKKFLDSRSIEYSFTDVDLLQGSEREATIEDVKKYNPRCTFPTIIIGDKVIIGFREDEIKEALHL